MIYVAVLPNGERIELEAWVYREWIHNRAAFFDSELGKQLATAERITPKHAKC